MSKVVKDSRSAAREMMPATSDELATLDLVPLAHWSEMGQTEHFVQFYETDNFLLDSLGGFVGKGLSDGDACIVVATQAHREGLEARLSAAGLDVSGALAAGQFVSLDAAETLSAFMVENEPDAALFNKAIGDIISQASLGRSRVRIFGEMVALLWSERRFEAAINLEKLWNELGKTHPFLLFCAYSMSGFEEGIHAGPLGGVCEAHTRVIPAESYTTLVNPDERLRTILELQQKARSLQSVKDELELQVEDLRRLHEMSLSLTSTLDIDFVLAEVLRAAMSVQGTNMGLLSLWDTERDGLRVKVHSGFDEEFLQQIEWVAPGAGACGTCYQQLRRVVVEDVETDPVFAPYREAARAAGFRSWHSTPLITRRGNIIGTLSVHFRERHAPSEREERLMDLYARMAADFIENAQLYHRVQMELEERERLLTCEQIARAEAESANRLKDEFLATVSHELRTPLTAIMGWTHMLLRGSLDPATANHAVETIERNARSQAQLVEDILDVSRVVSGKLNLNIGPVDAAAVINEAIDSVQLAADSKEIKLEVTLDPSARHINGDAVRLQQVVWNLLSNSIKFTPAGGRVEVRLERAGRDVEISISDTGEGISPEFLPFIFDRFRQADGTSTRRHGGLGLGLAIVRHLVELHGGTVSADSRGEGLGTTFTIRLPLAQVNEGDRNSSGKELRVPRLAETREGQIQALPSLDGVRVLLVDDDGDTLKMLSVILAGQRATVQTATSVAGAFEILEWYEPDVLVSDLAMPEEDGCSLIRKLREAGTGGGRQTPAVALTAYVRVEDRARALSAGFNMFVPKPIEPAELITAIANLTGHGPDV